MSRFFIGTIVSSKRTSLKPDPGNSCLFWHSSFVSRNILENFYRKKAQPCKIHQFLYFGTNCISMILIFLLGGERRHCGSTACKVLGIRKRKQMIPLQRRSQKGLKQLMHNADSYSLETSRTPTGILSWDAAERVTPSVEDCSVNCFFSIFQRNAPDFWNFKEISRIILA